MMMPISRKGWHKWAKHFVHVSQISAKCNRKSGKALVYNCATEAESIWEDINCDKVSKMHLRLKIYIRFLLQCKKGQIKINVWKWILPFLYEL